MNDIHDFKDVFGVDFGEVVQGTGLAVRLSKLNPKAKGRAMSVTISHQPWGIRPIVSTFFSLDTVGLSTARQRLQTMKRYWPTHWWWRRRVRDFSRQNEGIYFAWPSYFKMKRGAFPKAPGLLPGDTFHATFTMENGEGVCIKCQLPADYTGEPSAGFGQRNTDDELMYYCRY